MLKKQGKIGLIDFCGEQVLSNVYDEILWYNKSTFRVKKEGKWALVQKGDQQKTSFLYQHGPHSKRASIELGAKSVVLQ